MPPRRNGLALSALLVRAAISAPYLRPGKIIKVGNGPAKDSPEFWYHLTISVVLVLVGGLFAGWILLFPKPSWRADVCLSVWPLVLWDLTNSIFVCWPPHQKTRGKSWTRRKVGWIPAGTVHQCCWSTFHSFEFITTWQTLGTCCECLIVAPVVMDQSSHKLIMDMFRSSYLAMWFVVFRLCLWGLYQDIPPLPF